MVSRTGAISVLAGVVALSLAAGLASAQCQPDDIFLSPTTWELNFQRDVIALGDFDDDGLDDLALYSEDFGQYLSVIYGGFTDSDSVCSPCPTNAMVTTDLNADGIGDLVTLSGTGFAFYYGNGAADGAFETGYWQDFAGMSKLAAGDANSDGRMDLAFLDTDNGAVHIRRQTADGQFPTNDQTISIGGLVSDLGFADVNGDGRDDLLVLFTGFDWLMVYVQDGSGQLGGGQHYAIGSGVYARDIAVGDVDGDGDLDVVAACLNADTVAVMSNDGAGAFTASGSFATLTDPSQVALTDLNHDGMADIAVIGDTTQAVEVRVATGGGAFGPASMLESDSVPVAISFGSLNGDASDDLLVHCGIWGHRLYVYENACTLPMISTQPAPLAVIDTGESATLSVGVSSDFAPTYRWMKNGQDIVDDGHFSGAATNQLTISNALPAHTDNYAVRVTSFAGSTVSDDGVVAVRQSCVPDINGDGAVNTLDVIAFLNAWVGGC